MSNFYGDVERVITEHTKSDSDMVCEYCGCDRVQEKVWVDINTRRQEGNCEEDPYCPDCYGNVCTITRKEYMDAYEENI